MANKYSIINHLSDTHFSQALALSNKMWWSKDRTREEFATMMKHCIPFALIDNETQQLVGFARVMTDEVRYAYIYDVMVEEGLRGNGLGNLILLSIMSCMRLSKVKYFELTCTADMVNYYKVFGFKKDYENIMPMRYVNKQNL